MLKFYITRQYKKWFLDVEFAVSRRQLEKEPRRLGGWPFGGAPMSLVKKSSPHHKNHFKEVINAHCNRPDNRIGTRKYSLTPTTLPAQAGYVKRLKGSMRRVIADGGRLVMPCSAHL